MCPVSDLAMIFQPGMFSHPAHLNSANEHKIAVQVLEFLIEHQDHFVLGLSQPPPANISPSELTAVSRPVNPEEVYFEPSDSDEDLGTLEAHEGGGAKLAKKSSSPTSASGSGTGRRKHLLKKVWAGTEMTVSKTAQDPLQTRENEKLSSQVIAPRGISPLPHTSPPAGIAITLAESEAGSSSQGGASLAVGSAAGHDDSTPLGRSASNIKRSKTTPTRRPDVPGISPGGLSIASGRPSILERTSSRRRRKSHDTTSPNGSASVSPLVTPGG